MTQKSFGPGIFLKYQIKTQRSRRESGSQGKDYYKELAKGVPPAPLLNVSSDDLEVDIQP